LSKIIILLKIKYIGILTPFFYSKNIEIGGGNKNFSKIFLEKHENRFDFLKNGFFAQK